MKSNHAIVLIFITFFSAIAGAQDICDYTHFSKDIKYFTDKLKAESAVSPAWYNQRLMDYPIFILDSKQPQCAAFWHPEQGLKSVPLRGQFSIQYDQYEYLVDPSSFPTLHLYTKVPNVRDELLVALKNYSVQYALIWVYGTTEYDMSNPVIQKIPSRLSNSLRLAIHEAFHFFVQQNSVGIGKHWTAFAQDWPRDEDLQKCYLGNEAIKKTHRQEVEAISQAVLNLNDQIILMKKIDEFLSLRNRRYGLMPTITYKTYDGVEKTITCKLAEAKQELHEGVPQFIGNDLIIQLGLASYQKVVDEIRLTTDYYLDNHLKDKERPIQSYYHLASLELLTLKELMGSAFLPWTKKISESAAPTVLSDTLAETINRR